MKRELIITKDGSHSFYLPEMDEHYHSINGSITESQHIFVNNGLRPLLPIHDSIQILEVGFGTGLNAFTSFIESKKNQNSIQYHGLELYPMQWEQVKELNYSKMIDGDNYSSDFEKIHTTPWEEVAAISTEFSLVKIKEDLRQFEMKTSFHLIYFDAFAPEKQEEMWTDEIFHKLFEALKPGGVLVSYCVKGKIRRSLKEIGFFVEKLAGPIGGKREVLRAKKPNE